MGEELLLKYLGVEVITRTAISEYSPDYLYSLLKPKLEPDHTILFNGGGNLGDLYREHTEQRCKLLLKLANNKLVMFAQTLNYRNRSLANADNAIYSNLSDFTMMLRSVESFENARAFFPTIRTILIPDMAFMLGNLRPIQEPFVDIFFLIRIDFESSLNMQNKSGTIQRYLSTKNSKITFLVSKEVKSLKAENQKLFFGK